jgi:hypothetical protein
MELYVPGMRVPKDVDVFSDVSEPEIMPRTDALWHPLFSEWWAPDEKRYATLNELYTIKVSHSYWELKNGSWDKHMADQVDLRVHGAELDQELHDLLYRVWEEMHGSKRVNLVMTKEDFFRDAVKRVYDHDSIHVSVAYGDRPLYESVVADGHTVKMDMAKVWALPEADAIRLFREEVYATALERWVIPSGYTVSPRLAYHRALKKTITSLTKGRSAQFISERYDVFRKPDMDYVARHRSRSHLLELL